MYRIGNQSQWIPAQYSAVQLAGQQPSAPAKKTDAGQLDYTSTSVWTDDQEAEAVRDFISYVNAWLKQQGLPQFTQDHYWLQAGAEYRANDNLQLFNQTGEISHTRPNGQDFDDAFHTSTGSLGGENIGYVGNSNGMTPKQAAEAIAAGFINEGPDGGHYPVLHAGYGMHPLIGVAFRSTYRNGMCYYIMNMETGTNER